MRYRKENTAVSMSVCRNCGKNLEYDWKICPFCKTPVATTSCNYCGQEIKTDWSYCPHCKNEVKTEIKNKLRFDECNEWLIAILK